MEASVSDLPSAGSPSTVEGRPGSWLGWPDWGTTRKRETHWPRSNLPVRTSIKAGWWTAAGWGMGIDMHILYVYHSFLFSFRLIVDLSPEVVSPVKYFNRHRQKIDFPACQENQGCPLPLPEPIKNVIKVDIFTQPDSVCPILQTSSFLSRDGL